MRVRHDNPKKISSSNFCCKNCLEIHDTIPADPHIVSKAADDCVKPLLNLTVTLRCLTSLKFLERQTKQHSPIIFGHLPEDQQGTSLLHGSVQFVFDEGSLLHRVPWKGGSSCSKLTHMFAEYCARKHGKAAIVIQQ